MAKALRTFRVAPSLPDELAPLARLAHNLRWAWDHHTRDLFEWADVRVWQEVGGNPVALLGRISPERLDELAGDARFLARMQEVADDLDRYLTGPRWAQQAAPPPPAVAYFSPEFGLSRVVQTYSGGLGILAGDHLKAASDLGLELVGVGLLYRHGYFRQLLDADGWQRERYPDLNPHNLPLKRLEVDAEPALIEVKLADRTVAVQIWKADVGRVPLLLLDTDLPQNAPEDRTVTDRLYGGDNEHRLRQEIVLGIGGVRALELAQELGVVPFDPVIFHSNEGHAGFLQLERIRRLVVGQGMEFAQARECARAAVLFTTHTPVPAGIDRFPHELMHRYFTDFAAELGIPMERLLAVGREPNGDPNVFNMAVMGLKLSARANGVSKLHGGVSREMFAALWPGVEVPEVPITSVTNGVHAPTWVGPEMRVVFDRHLRPDWPSDPDAWALADEIPDDVLWRARGRARERLVQSLRGWARDQRLRRGEPASTLTWTESIFDPDALTIGFARRFAEYKRGTLLLSQPDRLKALLTASDRPVQLVFAGKAHPRDEIGKGLIRQIVHFSAEAGLRDRLIFVEDYDMGIARDLLAGCDVWLNNPRRPHEACGTSGMKAVLNGGLHASVLDGWWDEMFDGENGFAIGSRSHHPDVAQQDAADATSLFDVLERQIVPMFYERVDGGLPRRWLARIRRSLATLGPQVLATRMVTEYADELYTPLAERALRLTADGGRQALELARWRGHIVEHWSGVKITRVEVAEEPALIGQQRPVRVEVDPGAVPPEQLQVQLLHGPVTADGQLVDPEVIVLERVDDADGAGRYEGAVPLRASGEYGVAVRVVPHHEDLVTWANTGLVTWADGEHA